MNPDLLAWVGRSRHLVVLTGAGVSTLSGLPDFRGPTGLYQNPDYLRIFDLDRFYADPAFFYRHAASLIYRDHDLRASLVHQALARWEAQGLVKALITQNIDRLHQQAGSSHVIEVHGSAEFHHCLHCGASFPYALIAPRVQVGDIPPRCPCGGVIKPDITFFGENLPPQALQQALDQLDQADSLLVLGTSLTVYPVAAFPRRVLSHGGRVAIVNSQVTDLDRYADLVLRDLEEAFSP